MYLSNLHKHFLFQKEYHYNIKLHGLLTFNKDRMLRKLYLISSHGTKYVIAHIENLAYKYQSLDVFTVQDYNFTWINDKDVMYYLMNSNRECEEFIVNSAIEATDFYILNSPIEHNYVTFFGVYPKYAMVQVDRQTFNNKCDFLKKA